MTVKEIRENSKSRYWRLNNLYESKSTERFLKTQDVQA